MALENLKFQKYFETLSQNSLKGETYLIKFKDSPTVYVGIPILRSNLSSEDQTSFTLNVLEPKAKKGVYQKSLLDIELLKKK